MSESLEQAVFVDGRPVVIGSVSRCSACFRVDIPEHRLGLTPLDNEGSTFLVCRICCSISATRELATSGGHSEDTLVWLEEKLHEINDKLIRELAARRPPLPAGSSTSPPGQGLAPENGGW